MAPKTNLAAAELFLSPRVLRRIEGSVKRLCRKFRLSHADGDDLQQDFCVAVLQARQLYDPEKCTLHRFVLMAINRRYKHHVRRQMRMRKGLGRTINTVGFDDVEPGLDLVIVDPSGEIAHQRVDLRDELEYAQRDLPDLEQRICDLLMAGHTPRSASTQLNVAPSTVTRALDRIARHFHKNDCFSDFLRTHAKKTCHLQKDKGGRTQQ